MTLYTFKLLGIPDRHSVKQIDVNDFSPVETISRTILKVYQFGLHQHLYFLVDGKQIPFGVPLHTLNLDPATVVITLEFYYVDLKTFEPSWVQDLTPPAIETNQSPEYYEEQTMHCAQIPEEERAFLDSFPFPIPFSQKLGDATERQPHGRTGYFEKNGHVTRFQIACHYELNELPDHFDALPFLEVLAVENGNLFQIPPSICSLPHLRHLRLSRNKLASLPENIGRLSNLQYLNLSHNRLLTLPPSFAYLTRLRVLSLGSNHISRISFNFPKLKALDLDSNHFSCIPSCLQYLSSLETLGLGANNILDLPSFLGKLLSLKSIGLRENNLSTLPPSMANLTQLTNMNLRNNQFNVFPSWMASLSNLKNLLIDKNPLISLTGIPKHLYHHFMTDVKWEALPSKAQQFFLAHNDDALFAFYAADAMELAARYVTDPTALSPDEYYRLVSESTPDVKSFLSQHLPATSPLLFELDQKFSHPLSASYSILL